MLEPIDMTDWTLVCCPCCGWHWHSTTALARHVATIHGASPEVARKFSEAVRVYVTRLRLSIERDGSTPSAEKSQVSNIRGPRRVRS